LIATERDRLLAAWATILDDDTYVLGQHGEAFERELADYIEVDHAIGVSSGTDALALILKAVGVDGHEVLVPALSFIATAEAVIHAGGIPVFCDVDPTTWTMTPETAAPHLSERTRAIVAVHLFGNPAPVFDLYGMSYLRAGGTPIIEDACQAIGSTLDGMKCGGLTVAAAFSFYPSKTLRGCGDGGAVTTDDPDLAEKIRRLRHHGSEDGRLHTEVGGTHRLDELQAAALRIRLETVDEKVMAQREEAVELSNQFPLQQETLGGRSSWHRHVALFDNGAAAPLGRRFYDPPLHLQPSMRPYYRGPLPVAEDFARRNVCLSRASIPRP
jgi:dTDP-3-amino-3,4,6-trideoxy-alpha-D-glucose transaminase